MAVDEAKRGKNRAISMEMLATIVVKAVKRESSGCDATNGKVLMKWNEML